MTLITDTCVAIPSCPLMWATHTASLVSISQSKLKLVFNQNVLTSWCLRVSWCFKCFCTGHFGMVLKKLTCLHRLHYVLNISSIYITVFSNGYFRVSVRQKCKRIMLLIVSMVYLLSHCQNNNGIYSIHTRVLVDKPIICWCLNRRHLFL